MSHLFIKITKPKETEYQILSQSTVIGRSDQSDIKIDDHHCSKLHCKITLTPSGLFLEDLQSKNGTHLNGLKIQKAQIYLGDHLRIGETEFCIHPDKCSTDLKQILTYTGLPEKRMLAEIRVGNNPKPNNIKTQPGTHEEDLTALRMNPLFKDAAKIEQKPKNIKEKPKEKKSLLDKLNPFKK